MTAGLWPALLAALLGRAGLHEAGGRSSEGQLLLGWTTAAVTGQNAVYCWIGLLCFVLLGKLLRRVVSATFFPCYIPTPFRAISNEQDVLYGPITTSRLVPLLLEYLSSQLSPFLEEKSRLEKPANALDDLSGDIQKRCSNSHMDRDYTRMLL